MTDDSTDDRTLSLKVVMMPRDTNPYGTIFGGVILSYIDQAGAVGVWHEMQKAGWPEVPIVTVAMNGVEFHQPILVGDVVSFWTRPLRIGTSSITMRVDVEAHRAGKSQHLTEADVTYVAVELGGDQRQPIPLRGE